MRKAEFTITVCIPIPRKTKRSALNKWGAFLHNAVLKELPKPVHSRYHIRTWSEND